MTRPSPPGPDGAGGAYFDVDETLVPFKSMFRFLAFLLAERGQPPSVYERLVGELRTAAAGGAGREEINRRYYALYEGEQAADLSLAGRRWFAAECASGPVTHTAVHRELDAHRAAGRPLVLVSGSFFACLDPIADHLGTDRTLCTRPIFHNGVLTGRVGQPMIGTAKGIALRADARSADLDLAACHAYGDHVSDLPMLAAVGHPVAVGSDPALLVHAVRAGWRVLGLDGADTQNSGPHAASARLPGSGTSRP